MTKQTPVRAVIYARVSTLKDKQAASVENQLETCRQFCEQRGWEVVGKFTDRKSGKDFNRPGWQQMLASLITLQPNHIVVTARDRIARNHVEAAKLRCEVLPALGVTVVPVMGIADSNDPGLDLAICIDEVYAGYFRKMIAWKTSQGMRRNAEQGFWLVKPPYGTRPGKLKGVPVKDPDRWPWVLKMYEWAAQGMGRLAILRQLIAQGATPPLSGIWNKQVVLRTLFSHFFIGEVHYKGEVYPALHDCRVSLDLWEAAQIPYKPCRKCKEGQRVYLLTRVVSANLRINTPSKRRGESVPYYGHYTPGRGGRRYFKYYRADRLTGTAKVTLDGDTGSAPIAVRAEELEEALVEDLIKLAESDQWEGIIRSAEADQGRRFTQLQADLKLARRELSLAQRERQKLDKLLVKAFAQSEKVNAVLEALQSEVGRVQARISSAETAVSVLETQERNLQRTISSGLEHIGKFNLIKSLWETGDRALLRELLDILIDRVEIVDGEHAMLYLRSEAVIHKGVKVAPTGVEPVLPP